MIARLDAPRQSLQPSEAAQLFFHVRVYRAKSISAARARPVARPARARPRLGARPHRRRAPWRRIGRVCGKVTKGALQLSQEGSERVQSFLKVAGTWTVRTGAHTPRAPGAIVAGPSKARAAIVRGPVSRLPAQAKTTAAQRPVAPVQKSSARGQEGRRRRLRFRLQQRAREGGRCRRAREPRGGPGEENLQPNVEGVCTHTHIHARVTHIHICIYIYTCVEGRENLSQALSLLE
jgi:hypothetical protein